MKKTILISITADSQGDLNSVLDILYKSQLPISIRTQEEIESHMEEILENGMVQEKINPLSPGGIITYRASHLEILREGKKSVVGLFCKKLLDKLTYV